MRLAGRRDPEIASLQRRALAALIDAGVFLPPTVLVAVAGVKVYEALQKRRSGEEQARPASTTRNLGSARGFAESTRWQLGVWAASVPIEILLRNSRSPGARIMGLRRVDARTGGPVPVRSAVIHNVAQSAARQLTGRLARRYGRRDAERLRAMKAEIEETQRTHADDDARQPAATDVFRRAGMTSARSSGRTLLLGIVPNYLGALWSERNQTLYDRVAGIIIVVDE